MIEKTGLATVEQRNKMSLGDEIEVFGPYTDYFTQKIEVLLDEDDQTHRIGASSAADR